MESKYNENKFPSAEEKMNISKATGLNESQVSSWFARQRKKEKEGKIEVKKDGMYYLEIISCIIISY